MIARMKSGIEAMRFKMLPIPPTVNWALLGLPVGVGVGSGFDGAGGAVGGGVCGGADSVFHFSLSTQALQ